MSQNFFCCSQNFPKHILVLKKFILTPLFTVYRLFKNVNFWVNPPPPFGKSLCFGFFCCNLSLHKLQITTRLQFEHLPRSKIIFKSRFLKKSYIITDLIFLWSVSICILKRQKIDFPFFNLARPVVGGYF